LQITPRNISIRAGEAQAFQAAGAAGTVTWSIQPHSGRIDSNGVYTAPMLVFRNANVIVQAHDETQFDAATITLDPGWFWLHLVGLYWLGWATVLLAVLLGLWDLLCPNCRPAELPLSPPLATVNPSQPAQNIILGESRINVKPISTAHDIQRAAPKPPAKACQEDGTPGTASLIALIAVAGALGGLIHGASSFAIFAGNRAFQSSWTWWYVLRPVLGAAVALVVYLVLRSGFGGDLALSGADCLKTAGFAGLIGMFAEPATLKLKDIFNTLFTPREDPRK
jgi:hypothetical protein